MTVAAVVFDLDQTLFDHVHSARTGFTSWVSSLGAGPTPALVDAWFAAEERHVATWQAGEISWTEQRRRRLCDILPLLGRPTGTPTELDAVFEGYLAAYEAAWAPFDDAAECVGTLVGRGYRLALLTNGAASQQRRKLAHIGLSDAFEVVVTAAALGFAKPDPRAYLAVCDALALAPSECLHVGDNYALDVAGARAAGMPAVHLDRMAVTSAGDVITTLRDLPAYLERLTVRP